MLKRTVRRTGKDRDGDITKLCGDWGSVSKALAIQQIDAHTHKYVVEVSGLRQVDVLVKSGTRGKYLTTSPDGKAQNNLDDLPDC